MFTLSIRYDTSENVRQGRCLRLSWSQPRRSKPPGVCRITLCNLYSEASTSLDVFRRW